MAKVVVTSLMGMAVTEEVEMGQATEVVIGLDLDILEEVVAAVASLVVEEAEAEGLPDPGIHLVADQAAAPDHLAVEKVEAAASLVEAAVASLAAAAVEAVVVPQEDGDQVLDVVMV
jgi:urease accessory protein UreF